MNIKKTVSQIESYFNQPELIDFWHNCENFAEKNNSPTFNYLGLNFDNHDLISIKFYVHFFRDLSENEIVSFLPRSTEFLKFIHLKTETDASFFHPTNSGIALELKYIVGQRNPRKGFFYHLRNGIESYDAIGISRDEFMPNALGINYEYEDEKIYFKTYFYFSDKEKFSQLSNRLGISFFEDIHMIEIAKMDQYLKYNLIFLEDEFVSISKKSNHFSVDQWKIIEKLNEKFGLFNTAFGAYLSPSSTKSIYFFKTPDLADNALYSNVIPFLIKQNQEN